MPLAALSRIRHPGNAYGALTGSQVAAKLRSMKIYIPAAALFALTACGSTSPSLNNVQDVAANNMIADDVTEVQDDSAAALPSSEVEQRDAATANADNREVESGRPVANDAANAN
jgi:uncharacterized lipoprotein YajG